MIKLKSQKLNERILWGYSIPICLSILAALFVFIYTNEAKEKAKLFQNSNDVSIKLKQMEVEFFRIQKAARGYYLSSLVNKRNKSAFFAEYQQGNRNFDRVNEELYNQVEDNQKRASLNNIRILKQQIDRGYRKAFSLFDAGNPQQGLVLWNTQVLNKLNPVEIIIGQLATKERNELNQAAQQQKNALELLNTVVIISTAASTLLAIIIGSRIAAGIARKMNRSVNAIASSSSEIAVTIEQQERIATQQATSVNQTTVTMDELGVSSRQAAMQAEATASGINKALIITKEGTQTLEETLEGMALLNEKVGILADRIGLLSERATEIGNISQIVSDLANQTNMLSLNAAVEAARAGEQGKGFNVVAGEIRRLADRSKQSAQKINLLVADIQTAINSTVTLADESSQTVNAGMKLADRTAAAFAGVAKAINSVVNSSQQISLTSKQQAIAVEQVVDVMNTLNQGAAQTASGVTQVKISTQQLNEAAQNLHEMV